MAGCTKRAPPPARRLTLGGSVLLTALAVGAISQPLQAHAFGSEKPRASDGSAYLLWDVTPLGIDPDTAELLVDILQHELKRVLGERLLQEEGIIDANTRHLVSQCDDTHQCLVDAGRAANADRIIVGVVSAIGKLYRLNLKLIDVESGRSLNEVRVSLEGKREVLLPAVQQSVLELIDPNMLSGTLVVDVPLTGVSVFIDGFPAGITPIPGPIAKVPSGEHTLKLSSPIIEDYFSFFTIHHGKTTEVVVTPNQIEALRANIAAAEETLRVPVYFKWWFWTIIAGGAGLVAGGTALAIGLTLSGPAALAPTSLGTVSFR